MEIDFEPFSLSLASPLETADSKIADRQGFLVTATADGQTGIGEASPLPGFTESHEECQEALEAVCADPFDPLSGLADTPAARHGIHLALLDLRARMAGKPIVATLASDPTTEVPLNATVGDNRAPETAHQVTGYQDDGYECVKIKVGARSLKADRKRIERSRAAAGDELAIRVDVNGAWSREEAAPAMAWLGDADVAYVEQPLDPYDLRGHAILRQEAVPVALDESVIECGIDQILDADAADVLILKPMALGGIDRALSAASRAREADMEVVISNTIDAVIARTAAVHLAAALAPIPACGLATGDRLLADLATDPIAKQGGTATIPDHPGLGIDPDAIFIED